MNYYTDETVCRGIITPGNLVKLLINGQEVWAKVLVKIADNILITNYCTVSIDAVLEVKDENGQLKLFW